MIFIGYNALLAQCNLNIHIATTNNDSICKGKNTWLYIGSKYGNTSKYSITWTPTLPTKDSVAIAPTVTTKYKVVVDSASVCSGSDSITITVLALPITTIQSSSPSYCNGTANPVILSSSNTTLPAYLWSFNHSSNFIDSIFPTANTNVSLRITDSFGCVNNYTKLVYLNKPNFSWAMSVDTVAFSNTSSGNDLLYNWSFGDGSGSSVQNPRHFYSIFCKTYLVKLTITDTVTSCVLSYQDSIYVTPGSLSANFTYTVSGSNVVATNTSSGTFIKSYWNWGDGKIDSSSFNASHTYTSNYTRDSITLTVKNSFGCLSSKLKTQYTGCRDSFKYTINGTTSIDSVKFTSWSNQTVAHFTWTLNGGSLLTNSSSNPLVIAITSPIAYNMCLKTTDANSCISTFCKTIDLSTGINTVNFADNFNVFPNPTNSVVNINFNLNQSDKIYFTIYDVTGKKLFNTEKEYSSVGLKQETFDVAKFNNGLYLLEIKNQSKSSLFKKIVVSKN